MYFIFEEEFFTQKYPLPIIKNLMTGIGKDLKTTTG